MANFDLNRNKEKVNKSHCCHILVSPQSHKSTLHFIPDNLKAWESVPKDLPVSQTIIILRAFSSHFEYGQVSYLAQQEAATTPGVSSWDQVSTPLFATHAGCTLIPLSQ